MTVGIYAQALTDTTGNPLPNTVATVYTTQTGSTLATAYTDATGSTVRASAQFTSDTEGNLVAYLLQQSSDMLYWGQASGQSFRFPLPIGATPGSGGGGSTLYTVDAVANGCKIDGKTVYDAAITSGAATLTSATATFTTADTGKTFLVAGAGASGRELVATGTYVNATTITLGANASATVSGAHLTWGTDDTTAWQALINAAAATNATKISATITAPAGISILAGAQQSGTVTGTGNYAGSTYPYSGQLLIPAAEYGGPRKVVSIVGPTAPNFVSAYVTELAHQTGLIFRSTSGSATGAVIGAVPSQGGYSAAGAAQGPVPTSYIEVHLKNLTVRVAPDPLCDGVQGEALSSLMMENVTVDIDQIATTPLKPSSGTTNTAIKMPLFLNSGGSDYRRVQAIGFPRGFQVSEHSVLDNTYACQALMGYCIVAGTHAAVFTRILVQECTAGIGVDTSKNSSVTSPVTVYGFVDYEVGNGLTYLVDDLNLAIRGSLKIHNGSPRSGLQGTPIRGGTFIDFENVDRGGGGWMNRNPKDTFTRSQDMPSDLGISDYTSHPWYTVIGAWHTNGSAALPGGASNQIATVNGLTENPTVYMSGVTGTGSFNVGSILKYINSGTYLCVVLLPTGLIIQKIVGSSAANGVATTLASSSTAIPVSSSYNLIVTCQKSSPIGTSVVTAYLGGVQVATYTLTAAEETQFSPGAKTYGLTAYADSTSTVTSFEARGAAPAAATGGSSTIEQVNTVSSSGAAYTIPDVTVATYDIVTLTANCTFTFPGATAGKSFTLELVQDSTGSRTATWPATVKWSGGTAPTLTTAASKADIFSFLCDGTSWFGFTAGLNF